MGINSAAVLCNRLLCNYINCEILAGISVEEEEEEVAAVPPSLLLAVPLSLLVAVPLSLPVLDLSVNTNFV